MIIICETVLQKSHEISGLSGRRQNSIGDAQPTATKHCKMLRIQCTNVAEAHCSLPKQQTATTSYLDFRFLLTRISAEHQQDSHFLARL